MFVSLVQRTSIYNLNTESKNISMDETHINRFTDETYLNRPISKYDKCLPDLDSKKESMILNSISHDPNVIWSPVLGYIINIYIYKRTQFLTTTLI